MTTSPTERPAGYRLVVPPGWHRIDPTEERRLRDVRRIVGEQFAGTDNQPHLRRQIESSLLDHVARAAEDGALEVYLSTLRVGAFPLSGSLVVTLVPRPRVAAELDDADHQEMLLAAARETADGVVDDVRLVTWDDGWAVRRVVHRQAPAGDDPLGTELGPAPTFGVEWYRPIPRGDGATLLLAFSSPLIPIEQELTELFDTIAATLVWT